MQLQLIVSIYKREKKLMINWIKLKLSFRVSVSKSDKSLWINKITFEIITTISYVYNIL